MKIDVLWFWVAAFCLALVIQNFFTVKESEWDVSYTYTNDSMDYIAYGQTVLTCKGDTITWVGIKKFIETDVLNGVEESPNATVLAVHRRDVNRYWRPFWKEFAI